MSVRRSPTPARLMAAPVRLAPVRKAPTGAPSLVAVLRAGEAHLRRAERAPQPVGARTSSWESYSDFLDSASEKLAKENQEDVKLSTQIADLQAALARCNRKKAELVKNLEQNALEKAALMEENEVLIEKWQEFADARKEAEGPPEPASPSKAPYVELDAEKKEALAEARERFTEDPSYVGPDMRGWDSLTDEKRARAAKLAEREAMGKKQLAEEEAQLERLRRAIADAQRRGARRDPSMGGVDFYDPGFGFGASVENA